jgi:hypothetical protein
LCVLVFIRVRCHGANLYQMSGHERNAMLCLVTSVRNEVVERCGCVAQYFVLFGKTETRS